MTIEVNFYIQLIFAALTFIVLYRLIQKNSITEDKIKALKKRLGNRTDS